MCSSDLNGIIDYVYDSSSSPVNQIVENGGWVSNNISSESPNSFIFTGTYALTGSSDTLPIQLELDLQCQADASCDLSHTGAITLSLPSNVTFTSASGVFLTQQPASTAPEPAYTFILGAALLGIGALARRRFRRASAS